MGAPVILLFFTDGKARENENGRLRKLTAKLSKKHYIHSFVINSESSISEERGGARDKREKYINIASEMIRNMQLGENETQIAFVRYSGLKRTDTVFHFKNHYNASEAIEEIAKTPTLGGTTQTGAAMLDASKEFDRRFGGRTTAQKFMIVFTDAYSQDDPIDASAKLYQERVKVLAVAVDDAIQPPEHEQLKSIATDQKSIFLEKDFHKLFTYFSQCRQ
uniref:VWFA domain-containing protein n=1 Tax=Panagrolaimus sp. PS1159 TaxID=55785 RepID=A0AC35EQ17_9BILA